MNRQYRLLRGNRAMRQSYCRGRDVRLAIQEEQAVEWASRLGDWTVSAEIPAALQARIRRQAIAACVAQHGVTAQKVAADMRLAQAIEAIDQSCGFTGVLAVLYSEDRLSVKQVLALAKMPAPKLLRKIEKLLDRVPLEVRDLDSGAQGVIYRAHSMEADQVLSMEVTEEMLSAEESEWLDP